MASGGIYPEQVSAGLFHGIPTGIGLTIGRTAAHAGRALELAGSVPVGFASALAYGDEQQLLDKYFQTFDPSISKAVDYFTPSPGQVGTVGNVLGGLTETLGLLAAGGGNPTLMLTTEGLSGAAELSRQGVSPDVAAAAGTLEAGANALGFRLPILGKSLSSRLATGAVGNLALGRASSLAEQQLLSRTGNEKQAEGINPWDLTGASIDLLTGLAFGGITHFGNRPVKPSERDAALAALNARHFQSDTAPGEPVDLEAFVAHQQAIDQGTSQHLRGEPVTAPEAVQNALFAQRQEPAAPEIPKDLQQLDAERTLTSPIPAGDAHVARLPPEQQQAFRDTYARAAEAKPGFDSTISQIASEVGGKGITAALKGTKRAVEKILGDYAGVASRIKDVLRATIEVKTLADARGAITQLQGHSGLEVLDTGARDLLSPEAGSLNGYRDAKFNVRTANGSIAEVQINLKPMLEAKGIGHSLYSEWDTITRKAREQNRPLTEAEASRRDDLGGLMEALYEPVWKRLMSDAKASGETGPPLRSAESIGNRRGGPSNAMESRPPSGVGTNATGMPSTSSSREPLGSEAGSSAGTGADTGKPPTAGIVPESGAPKAASAHNATFAVESARKAALTMDIAVPTGEFNRDGTPVTMTARELLARGDAEIAEAQKQAKAIEAVGACFLATGAS